VLFDLLVEVFDVDRQVAGTVSFTPATRDFRLTAGSAMIDAGDPAALASDEPVTDLDGLSRLVNGDGDCTARRDLGAFEYQPSQRAPTAASATATPGSVATGQAVTFSGQSCDPDGDSLTFSWAFDDGTSATGAQVSKAFATGGTHGGTVTVSDPGGRSVTAAASVVAVAPAPLSILSFSMLRQTFAVGSAPTPVSAAAKPKRGSAFRYRLSKAGNVSITIHALLSGRISRGRCVKPTRKLRTAKKCARAVKRGTLRRAGAAGNNDVPFSGRIGRKALARGSYRATIAAPGATSRTARFTIVGGS
jgi:PKD repeat protein